MNINPSNRSQYSSKRILQRFKDEIVQWHTVFKLILNTEQAVNKLRGSP